MLSQTTMEEKQPEQFLVPLGTYAYGLNLVLPALSGAVITNSKRVLRNFRLTSVNSALLFSVTNWSLVLGTVDVDWFGDYVRCETILGDAALPHFLPADGVVIEKGDFIVARLRNDSGSSKRIALIFQGEHV